MGIFHACDIRGKAGTDLSDVMARKIALAVGVRLAGQKDNTSLLPNPGYSGTLSWF